MSASTAPGPRGAAYPAEDAGPIWRGDDRARRDAHKQPVRDHAGHRLDRIGNLRVARAFAHQPQPLVCAPARAGSAQDGWRAASTPASAAWRPLGCHLPCGALRSNRQSTVWPDAPPHALPAAVLRPCAGTDACGRPP